MTIKVYDGRGDGRLTWAAARAVLRDAPYVLHNTGLYAVGLRADSANGLFAPDEFTAIVAACDQAKSASMRIEVVK